MRDKKDIEGSSQDYCNLTRQHNLNGIIYKILVSGNHTENKYSIIEITFPQGEESEIPLHKHGNEALIIHVIEGNFLFRYGKETLKGNNDAVLRFEKDKSHSYKKLEKIRANYLQHIFLEDLKTFLENWDFPR